MVRGRHFEHEKINAGIMLDVFEKKILPWSTENCLVMLVMDNDPKLHGKAVVLFMKENGVQIYPGGGKNPWVKSFCFMVFDFMRTVKKMVTLREVIISCHQKLNLQVYLNLRKKM